MSANPIHNPATSRESELVITRLFDAPRDLVYQVWTEPQHLAKWQNAPQGLTVTVYESDIRTGGSFRICMRSPEGQENWLQGPETLVTITFAERDGNTEITLRQTGFKSAEARDGHRYGWTSTFDRLAEYLSTLSLSTLNPATSNSSRLMKEKK
jgi:uncharacterized protein YndB with AHSA1/START domain